MIETDVTAPDTEKEVPQTRDYPALEIDYELYMKMLEDSEWTDDQKREFIETMWSIIVSFVDLGFGIHPVQLAQEEGGQIDNLSSVEPGDLVSSWDETDAHNETQQKVERLDGERS
ncbi:MAG: hypothetical protein AAF234_06595 [Pseudomonadota bacterium]